MVCSVSWGIFRHRILGLTKAKHITKEVDEKEYVEQEEKMTYFNASRAITCTMTCIGFVLFYFYSVFFLHVPLMHGLTMKDQNFIFHFQ